MSEQRLDQQLQDLVDAGRQGAAAEGIAIFATAQQYAPQPQLVPTSQIRFSTGANG